MFIFASSGYHPGYPIYIKKVQLCMKRLLKLAGLNENLTPHSLRHTHTSLLAEAKVSLEKIMDRLGHSDDHTTKNIYLHVTKELKKDASQKFRLLIRSLQKYYVSISTKKLLLPRLEGQITSCRP